MQFGCMVHDLMHYSGHIVALRNGGRIVHRRCNGRPIITLIGIIVDTKMMYIVVFVLGALLVLSGCSTIAPKDQTLLDETVILCPSKAECDIKWAAAKGWALNHSNMKLDVYSDDFIEADDSTKDSRHLAFIIRKQPTANPGVYAIYNKRMV